MEVLKITKVQENAGIPKRATECSAGLDLCACIDAPLTLNSGDTALIPTGLAIELPSSQYGAKVEPRAALSRALRNDRIFLYFLDFQYFHYSTPL